jgi:hypothetical protein
MSLDKAFGSIPRFSVRASNTEVANFTGSAIFTSGTFVKLAGTYKANDFSASFNSSSHTTDASGALPVSIVQMEIGRLGSSQAEYINGTIKKIAYYPKRLTNAELQGLTTV